MGLASSYSYACASFFSVIRHNNGLKLSTHIMMQMWKPKEIHNKVMIYLASSLVIVYMDCDLECLKCSNPFDCVHLCSASLFYLFFWADVPSEVDSYHSLFPLEPLLPPNRMQKTSNFSYITSCYKAVNSKDDLPYCLRRIHGKKHGDYV